MSACHRCGRTLRVGESAWASDWTVITLDGPRMEVRYGCDDCEPQDAEVIAPAI